MRSAGCRLPPILLSEYPHTQHIDLLKRFAAKANVCLSSNCSSNQRTALTSKSIQWAHIPTWCTLSGCSLAHLNRLSSTTSTSARLVCACVAHASRLHAKPIRFCSYSSVLFYSRVKGSSHLLLFSIRTAGMYFSMHFFLPFRIVEYPVVRSNWSN